MTELYRQILNDKIAEVSAKLTSVKMSPLKEKEIIIKFQMWFILLKNNNQESVPDSFRI